MPTLIKILADLNERQKDIVDSWEQPHHDFSDHVFGPDQHRVTFPLKEHNKNKINETKEAITNHLEHHGHEVSDYTKGLAKDKHGRDVKIGSLLEKTKANAGLKKQFETDTERAGNKSSGKSVNGLHITVSRDPHDVAAMSTGQGWTSCMNMDGGSNKHYLPKEIKSGTHVAYLHRADDKDLKNPVARILLKPHTAPHADNGYSDTVIRPESEYGTSSGSFMDHLNTWTKTHFPLKPGHDYHKDSDVYDDTGKNVINHETEEPLQKSYKPGEHYEHGKMSDPRIGLIHNLLKTRNPSEALKEVEGHHKDVDDAILNSIHEGKINKNSEGATKFLHGLIHLNHPDHSGKLRDIVKGHEEKEDFVPLIQGYMLAGRHEDAKELVKHNPELLDKIAKADLHKVGNQGIDKLIESSVDHKGHLRDSAIPSLEKAAKLGHEGHRQKILELAQQAANKPEDEGSFHIFDPSDLENAVAEHTGNDETKRELFHKGLQNDNYDLSHSASRNASPKLRMEMLEHLKGKAPDVMHKFTPKEVGHFIENRYFDPESEYHIGKGENSKLFKLSRELTDHHARELLNKLGDEHWSANHFGHFQAKDGELSKELGLRALSNLEKDVSGSATNRNSLIAKAMNHPETGREMAKAIIDHYKEHGSGGDAHIMHRINNILDKYPELVKEIASPTRSMGYKFMQAIAQHDPKVAHEFMKKYPSDDGFMLGSAVRGSIHPSAKLSDERKEFHNYLYDLIKKDPDYLRKVLKMENSHDFHDKVDRDWHDMDDHTKEAAIEHAPTHEHLDNYEQRLTEKPSHYHKWKDSDDEDEQDKATNYDYHLDDLEEMLNNRRRELEDHDENEDW